MNDRKISYKIKLKINKLKPFLLIINQKKKKLQRYLKMKKKMESMELEMYFIKSVKEEQDFFLGI